LEVEGEPKVKRFEAMVTFEVRASGATKKGEEG